MRLLLLPSCRSWQCSQPRLPLFVSSATFYMLDDVSCLLICAVWDFIFLLIYAYVYALRAQYSSPFFLQRATSREAVSICALLSLMKALWTDDAVSSSCADSVRGRSCGLQVCPRCCLDDGVNTLYDKLGRENTAGSEGSGMRQPVESVYSFCSEIDDNMLTKRWNGGEIYRLVAHLEVITSLTECAL